jgi:hypothetical protein
MSGRGGTSGWDRSKRGQRDLATFPPRELPAGDFLGGQVPAVVMLARVGPGGMPARLPHCHDCVQGAQGGEWARVRLLVAGHCGFPRSFDRTVHTRLQST